LVDDDQAKLKEMRETALGGEAKVETVHFNFHDTDEWQEYEKLCQSLHELAGGKENISVLVNNVEERDPHGIKIHKASDKELLQTLNKNTFPIVFMTRFLGPELKARGQKQTKSAIINMTSSYADTPAYNLPIFSASKSFSDVFSQNLWYENQEMDILTVKNMPHKSEANPLGVDAGEIVEGALLDLGHERISYGHSTHSLFRHWHLLQQCPWLFSSKTWLGKMSGL